MLENDDALQIVRTDLANLVATAAKTNSCDIEVFLYLPCVCSCMLVCCILTCIHIHIHTHVLRNS